MKRSLKSWLQGERRNPLFMLGLSLAFLALGILRFHSCREYFTLVDVAGCVVGAFGGFFILLVADYLLHHARVVFIPWILGIVTFAAFEPHFSVGLCASLWFILATQNGS